MESASDWHIIYILLFDIMIHGDLCIEHVHISIVTSICAGIHARIEIYAYVVSQCYEMFMLACCLLSYENVVDVGMGAVG